MKNNANGPFRHAESSATSRALLPLTEMATTTSRCRPLSFPMASLSIQCAGRSMADSSATSKSSNSSMGSVAPTRSPQMVDELVVGYGPNPRQQRLALDPCMPLQVHGEQCLLYDILNILDGGAGSGRRAAARTRAAAG